MDPHLQDLHPVYNFLPPPNDPLASQQASKAWTGGGNGIFILGERWIQLMVFLVVWIPGIPRKWKGWKGLGFRLRGTGFESQTHQFTISWWMWIKNNMKKRPDGH